MSQKQTKAQIYRCFATHLIESNDLISFGGGVYKYCDGIWELQNKESIESFINDEFEIEHFSPLKKDTNEILNALVSKTFSYYYKEIDKINKQTVSYDICLNNGILDIRTKQLREYKREEMKFSKLQFDYKEGEKFDNKKAKRFLLFLCEIFEITPSLIYDLQEVLTTNKDDKEFIKEISEIVAPIRFIQEWIGYSLIPGNNMHKSLIMVGDGRNGKGVLKEIWTKLIGNNNVSYLDIPKIQDERYIGRTRNKLINFSPDMTQGSQLDSGVIKTAVSGEEVTANDKYKDTYHFKFTAKLVMLCNEMPFVKTIGAAVRERFYVLPFNKNFTQEEIDHNLVSKLELELEQIFLWALTGLERLQKQKIFTVPKCVINEVEKLMINNDNIGMFLEEEDVVHENDTALKSDLYSDYAYFCRQSGYKAYGRNKFYQQLDKKGFKSIKIKGLRYFKNLKCVDNAPSHSLLKI